EIRSADEFGSSVVEFDPTLPLGGVRVGPDIGLILNRTIDTNDRLAHETTLVAPRGDQVVDGQTFAINDGVDEVVFEYEDPELGNGVAAGNVEIRFKSFNSTLGMFVADADHIIARRIRDAVNSPQVQTRLDITAATSDGKATGTSSTSNRVDLFGGAIVEQPDPFSITEVTNDATQLRDVLAGNGIVFEGTPRYTGGSNSAGLFTGGLPILGMERGIILSTGDARAADGPNSTDTLVGRSSLRGDADLDAEFALDPTTGPVTEDSTSLEFDFRMVDGFGLDVDGTLNLNFVFASEEYNEQLGTDFSDVLAIFVDGQNIALVPGTTDRVSVATVHSGNPFDLSGATGQNPTMFINNDPQDGGRFLEEFGYDGLTRKITASLPLNAGMHSIKIVIADVGDTSGDSAVFIEANSLADAPFVLPPTGIQNVRHTGFGDQNLFRPQGQVKIHSNTITQPKTAGIVADAGLRQSDGQLSQARDALALSPPHYVNGSPTNFASNVPIRLQQPSPGPVRNLVAENNTPSLGGFTPGVSIVNNTVDSPGLVGIHVSGDTVPWELTMLDADSFCDGDTFSITAFDQTVTFEYEDINGAPTISCGSGAAGGDGWTNGNVPVFFRRSVASTYRFFHPIINPGSTFTSVGYTALEMAIAVKDAIDSSILVSNDSTLVVQAIVGASRASGDGTPGGGNPAVYVEHASLVRDIGRSSFSSLRPAALGRAPQPFSKVVNNTVFGHDGTSSSFPEPNVEPNDTIFNAIDTRQGTQRTPLSYTASGRIDDTVNFRENLERDVDFYQFELNIGDRVSIDVDANSNGGTLNSILRLFDSAGEEVAVNFAAGAPGEVASGNDPYIEFTALANGTYYAAVSGFGNDKYSPLSLANRTAGGSTGAY
ncbi:MAG TPA: DVUA0089 family protein, partial [Pirellulaceae bacterium]|nr:DVUA0089 family protein [Pirellulaceae bacterium]